MTTVTHMRAGVSIALFWLLCSGGSDAGAAKPAPSSVIIPAPATAAVPSGADQHSAANTVGTPLGGLDLLRICRDALGKGASAVLIAPEDAYSWRCKDGEGMLYSINMDVACQLTYDLDAYAAYGSFSDPYSWQCYDPS